MIEVKAAGGNVYEVTVQGGTTTTHRVTVDPAYARKLGGDGVDVKGLVRASTVDPGAQRHEDA